eukprot:6488794-Amphidinium_carterae.1
MEDKQRGAAQAERAVLACAERPDASPASLAEVSHALATERSREVQWGSMIQSWTGDLWVDFGSWLGFPVLKRSAAVVSTCSDACNTKEQLKRNTCRTPRAS